MLRKGVIVAISVFMFSNSFAFGLSDKVDALQNDIMRLKEDQEKSFFLAKQVASQVVDIKEFLKEINTQIEKQNTINSMLTNRIQELERKVEELSKKDEKKVEDKSKPNFQIGYIKSNNVPLKSDPKGAVKVIVSKGFKVIVLEREGKYYKVKLGEDIYYVSAKHITVGGRDE